MKGPRRTFKAGAVEMTLLVFSCSHSSHSWLDVSHLVSASRDDLHLLVENLTISESQRLTDFLNRCLHVKSLSWKSGIWIVLRNVQRDPFASLKVIEGEDGKRGGEVSPGCKGTSMDTTDASAIAVELSGIIVFEHNMAHISIGSVLNFLSDFIAIDSEDVLGVSDLDNGVWIELQLEGIGVVSLINSLDLQESLLDVVNIVLTLLSVRHFKVVNSLLQCVHLCDIKSNEENSKINYNSSN